MRSSRCCFLDCFLKPTFVSSCPMNFFHEPSNATERAPQSETTFKSPVAKSADASARRRQSLASGETPGAVNASIPTSPQTNMRGTENCEVSQPDVKQTSIVNRFCRDRVLARFSSLRGGAIHLNESNGGVSNSTILGQSGAGGLVCKLYVRDQRFYRRVLMSGTIGSAESYMDGQWQCDRLTDLIRLFIRNADKVSRLEKTWSRGRRWLHRLRHFRRKNSQAGSRRNIQEHYDLGNDFYRLFLDPTLNYSSAVFTAQEIAKHGKTLASETAIDSEALIDDDIDRDQPDLLQASENKMRRICEKLHLCPEDRVVEIGTGWGALAIFMAENYGCHVTTTTISKEQHAWATAAVAAKGLEDRVSVLLQDYRTLEGKYDKLVSIEMIEAVGHRFMDTYFRQCNDLLRDGGEMLIQAILIAQQHEAAYRRGIDFIRAYIFPGGCLPSIGSISRSVGRSTEMRVTELEDITPHYALTLRCWRAAFLRQMNTIKSQGFDDRFLRLWHFYLCYCEAAFAERRCHTAQIVFRKSANLTH